MQHRFSSGMNPLEYKKRLQITATASSTFRRVNLSLASCTSAELASVSVRIKNQRIKLYLQTVEKSSQVHYNLKKLM